MIPDREIWQQSGMEAAERADELLEKGDTEGSAA
jgi:hypothetical protein